jgi:hypothetical protein
MTQITVNEAKELLAQATARYREIEKRIADEVPGESTPERVIRTVELQAALHEAAQDLIEAERTATEVDKETTAKRRERAKAELDTVETELVEAVAEAEADMAKLNTSLARVLDLSKRRYAYRQEATGRAPRSLLARNAVQGWLTWRVSSHELPGMDHAPAHYRAPLDELLGLNTKTDTETGGEK